MKGAHTNSGKSKRKKRARVVGSTDPLTREHSQRHGKAVKSGMKQAKQFKHAVLRATSRAKGKSKAQVAAELLVGSAQRVAFVRSPPPDEKNCRRPPALD